MDRKRLIDSEIRRRAKKPTKFNSAFITGVGSNSINVPSGPSRCFYAKIICQKIDKKGFRPCITSKNLDGSKPRFCGNVPIKIRDSLAYDFQESVKDYDFKDRLE